MKIKRPLINPLYEPEMEEPEELNEVEPLKPPTFTPSNQQLKSDIQKSITNSTEVIKKTKLVEPFINEPVTKHLVNQVVEIPSRSEFNQFTDRISKKTKITKRIESIESVIHTQAVAASEMPQRTKQIKKTPIERPSEDQLDLQITPKKITFQQRLQYFKIFLERRQELLEISTLWKNPSLPFNIISIIFVLGLLFIGGIFEFDRIPARIPMFYNHVEKSWEQTDKSTVFIIGIIVLIAEATILNLIMRIFRSDRRLALTLSWIISFINVLIIVAILQIYSLIT